MNKLEIKIRDVYFKNPFLLASGVWDIDSGIDTSCYGAVILKGVNLKGKQGNPPPRVYEVSCGMINSIGLQNNGVNEIIKRREDIKKLGTKVFANVFGSDIEEFGEIVEKLNFLDGFEINVSCPNYEETYFGRSPETVYKIVSLVRKKTDKLVFVKIIPDTDFFIDVSLNAEEAGADGIVCANTYRGLVVNIHSRRPVLGGITGGISGQAIKPLTMFRVFSLSKKLKIPIIASGGICKWEDAIEYILCGASLLEIGSAIFKNPFIINEITENINKFLDFYKINDIIELKGKMEVHNGSK